MKRHFHFLLSPIAIIIIAFTFTNCAFSKKTTKLSDLDQPLFEQHCSGNEFQSNKDFYRASTSVERMDQNVVKQKRLTNARTLMAQQLEVVLRNVTVNYIESAEANNVVNLTERFEGMTKEITEQKLSGTRVICDKMNISENGNYVSYVSIEFPIDDIVSKLRLKLTDDQMLRIDYDYEKFKKTFEEHI